MSHDEETWRRTISESIKYKGKCTRSNKTHINFGKIAKELTLCVSYRPLPHVGKIGLNLTYCKSVLTKPTILEGLYNSQQIDGDRELSRYFFTTELSLISPKFKYIYLIKFHTI